jgi:hypothetical protein
MCVDMPGDDSMLKPMYDDHRALMIASWAEAAPSQIAAALKPPPITKDTAGPEQREASTLDQL